jgi:heme A synthase
VHEAGMQEESGQGSMSARLASTVLVLLGLQFALGVVDVLLLAPAWMQLLHLLGADVYWVALVLLTAETLWPDRAQAPSGAYMPSSLSTLV